jgi:small subunit ribosomal protein S20
VGLTDQGSPDIDPPVAQHASALKRHRQSEKRRARNKGLKTQLRHIIRSVRASVEKKDPKDAAATLATASKALSKAASKGVIHRNAASRKIARLSRAVHALSV